MTELFKGKSKMKNILDFINTVRAGSLKIKLAVIWAALMGFAGISVIGLLFVKVPELLFFLLLFVLVFGILGVTFFCLEVIEEAWTAHKNEIYLKERESRFLK